MCRRICIIQYKDVIILLFFTVFKICEGKFLALDFNSKCVLKGLETFHLWSDMYNRGDLYWNKANRPPEVAAFSLKKYCNKKNVVFYFLVLHHFLAKFKYEKRLKKLKSSESELKKNSSKTLKSLKTGIKYRYLARTSLDFNILKNGFRI